MTASDAGAIVASVSEIDETLTDIAEVTRILVPRLQTLGKRVSPTLQRELWPGGPPAMITWAALGERSLARLDHDERVRFEHLGRPGHLDRIIFGEDRLPGAISVLDLIDLTTRVIAGLASGLERDPPPAALGRMIVALFEEMTLHLACASRACNRPETAQRLHGLLPALASFAERIREAEANRPPKPVLPTAPNGEASAALLKRHAARVLEIAPALADVVDREVFGGSPPARLSFLAIQAALDVALYGDDMPDRVNEVYEMVAKTDRLIVPDDDEPFSALELFEGTAQSIRGAAEKLLALPPAERDEVAPAVELQARLFVLSVVGIAQAMRLQLLVADLAAAVGMNPIPYPDDLQGGGSA